MIDSVEEFDLHLEEISSMLTMAQNCVDRTTEKDMINIFGGFRTCLTNLRAELDDICTGLMLMMGDKQSPQKAGNAKKEAMA